MRIFVARSKIFVQLLIKSIFCTNGSKMTKATILRWSNGFRMWQGSANKSTNCFDRHFWCHITDVNAMAGQERCNSSPNRARNTSGIIQLG